LFIPNPTKGEKGKEPIKRRGGKRKRETIRNFAIFEGKRKEAVGEEGGKKKKKLSIETHGFSLGGLQVSEGKRKGKRGGLGKEKKKEKRIGWRRAPRP